MSQFYKSPEGERLVLERYQAFLKYWPVPHEQRRVPTREGETFVVASGDLAAPALVLFHGGMTNSVIWMGDVATWAKHFRVYAVDLIGEPGLSAPSRPPLDSEAYALWLDDVLRELCVDRASLVGASLGGWLALDYATRRPERVERLVLLAPAGLGRQKLWIVFKMVFLRMCGAWGTRRLRESILGKADGPPALQKFMQFLALIHEHFRPRVVKIPVQPDEALRRLRMPVMAILGGKDVLLDSDETRRRLQLNVPQAVIRYLPDAGHAISKQTSNVLEFLKNV